MAQQLERKVSISSEVAEVITYVPVVGEGDAWSQVSRHFSSWFPSNQVVAASSFRLAFKFYALLFANAICLINNC